MNQKVSCNRSLLRNLLFPLSLTFYQVWVHHTTRPKVYLTKSQIAHPFAIISYYTDAKDAAVCSTCYLASVRKCADCGQPIPPTVAVFKTWEGKHYHMDCFRCKGCGKPLGNKEPPQLVGGVVIYREPLFQLSRSCDKSCRLPTILVGLLFWMRLHLCPL